jgi:apolipoprotein D and lipocalin family protein
MKTIICFIMCLSTVFATAGEVLPTVDHVDVAKYIGKWYAVSSLPQFFTMNCVAQTAEYGIINSNTISVINTCIKKNGHTTDIEGQAVVTDPKTNARLIVTFNNFFTKLFRVKGEYVIIKLSEGYDTVLVGTTNRKSLWILSRIPNIDPDTLAEYKNAAKDLGFNVNKLIDSKF